ncbi:hypothetical protein D9M68_918520 [compost metagenome]
MAALLGRSEDAVIESLQRLLSQGDLTRFGPLFQIERAGGRFVLAAMAVPADAPPLFVAIAADDGLFSDSGFGLVEGWRAARRPVEFHLYEQGGHGFGMYRKPTTSTGWFDAFASWMAMHGWLERVGQGGQPAMEEKTR